MVKQMKNIREAQLTSLYRHRKTVQFDELNNMSSVFAPTSSWAIKQHEPNVGE